MAPKKAHMRLATERWFAVNKQWINRSFHVMHSCAPEYDDLLRYVHSELGADPTFQWLVYPNGKASATPAPMPSVQDAEFRSRMGTVIKSIRTSYGVKLLKSVTLRDGTKRKRGDDRGSAWSEIKRKLLASPMAMARHQLLKRLAERRYRDTDHARIVDELRNEAQRELRQQAAGRFMLNRDLPEMGGMSGLDYATNVGGVYFWECGQSNEYVVDREAFRFLINDPNPVLRWNPHGVIFEDNICPYEERDDHGLENLTLDDCLILGITNVRLLDENMTLKEALAIEKALHYTINGKRLGHQRLHRVPGASSGSTNTNRPTGVRKRVVGATFLPPDFFKNNPNI
ncbi:MAG: hypothetical protein SGILL_007254, partial [Bacillariaceae sp.]